MTYTSANKQVKRKKRRRKNIIKLAMVIVLLVVVAISIFFIIKKIQTTQVMKLVGTDDVTIEVFTPYEDSGIKNLLAEKDELKAEIVDSNVNTEKPGKYTVTYNITSKKGKNPIKVVRTVDVVDKTAPVISILGGTTVSIKEGSTFTDAGIKAIDNVDGDISTNVVATGEIDIKTIGEYTINYTVKDTSGNESKAVRTVKVTKNTVSAKYAPQDQTIYLTFDDGPSARTPELLDILKKYNIKATFFIQGQYVDAHADVVRRTADEGHALALHTYSHDYQKIYASQDAYFADLTKVREKVKAVSGVDSTIVRFPGGTSNTISRKANQGIMSALSKEIVDRGYLEYDWNVDSGDANGKKYTSEDIFNNLKSGLNSKTENFICLMHDAKPKAVTPGGVEMFIKYALEQGYKFDKITETTPVFAFKPLN